MANRLDEARKLAALCWLDSLIDEADHRVAEELKKKHKSGVEMEALIDGALVYRNAVLEILREQKL